MNARDRRKIHEEALRNYCETTTVPMPGFSTMHTSYGLFKPSPRRQEINTILVHHKRILQEEIKIDMSFIQTSLPTPSPQPESDVQSKDGGESKKCCLIM